jgi:hypothetical protein
MSHIPVETVTLLPSSVKSMRYEFFAMLTILDVHPLHFEGLLHNVGVYLQNYSHNIKNRDLI